MTAWIIRMSQHDERMLFALVRRRRPWLGALMHGVTHLGDASTAIALTLALLVGAVPALGSVAGDVAFTLAFSHLLVQAVKRTVTRPRPRLPEGVASLIRAPDRFSFPSGHSAAAFSIAVPIAAVAAPLLSIAILGLALLVGLSRCYLGVHYPGDVLAGALLAVLSSLAIDPLLAVLTLL